MDDVDMVVGNLLLSLRSPPPPLFVINHRQQDLALERRSDKEARIMMCYRWCGVGLQTFTSSLLARKVVRISGRWICLASIP
mmetsp:Transcript_12171/g.29731  ORF Transcript_12171/g.29731 Transcript_12171/m.29731 type:complete len:82 (+) Transcript_12171:3886-4131(+)